MNQESVSEVGTTAMPKLLDKEKGKETQSEVMDQAFQVDLKKLEIDAPDRRKEELKNIDDLAKNLDAIGQIDPIVLEPANKNGKYRVIAGKRRVAAAKKLGWHNLKALVWDPVDTPFEIAVIAANLFHQVPNEILQAEMYKKLIDTGVYKNQSEMARATGIDQSLISRRIKRLQAPDDVKEAIADGDLPASAVDKVPKAKMKDITPEKIKLTYSSTTFRPLPKECLQTGDGKEISVKIGVSDDSVKVNCTLSASAVAKHGVLGAIKEEIDKVGDKELTGGIVKFRKDIVRKS